MDKQIPISKVQTEILTNQEIEKIIEEVDKEVDNLKDEYKKTKFKSDYVHITQDDIDSLLEIVVENEDNNYQSNKKDGAILYDFRRPCIYTKKELMNFKEKHQKLVSFLENTLNSEYIIHSVDQISYGEYLMMLENSYQQFQSDLKNGICFLSYSHTLKPLFNDITLIETSMNEINLTPSFKAIKNNDKKSYKDIKEIGVLCAIEVIYPLEDKFESGFLNFFYIEEEESACIYQDSFKDDIFYQAKIVLGKSYVPTLEYLSINDEIQLDTKINDRCLLLIDNTVIAKGEVVIVDGCFSIMIQEQCQENYDTFSHINKGICVYGVLATSMISKREIDMLFKGEIVLTKKGIGEKCELFLTERKIAEGIIKENDGYFVFKIKGE